MSNSSLAGYTLLSPNYSPGNYKKDTVTVHCFVGQVDARRGCQEFASESKGASCNYVVGYDGSKGLCVEERNRSWCSSNRANDERAVTIEVACDAYYPYRVTNAAYAALIDLLTDICQRNKIDRLRWRADPDLIGQPAKQNMTVHRWFEKKSCPGDYLYSLHYQIAAEVNKRLEDGDDMTRDETLQLIKQEMDRRDPTYNLLSEVPEYWREDIGELITLGVIRGAGGGKLALTKTKAWCAAVLKRALEANDKIYKTINDVPEWGRPYVQARMDAGTLTGQKTDADGNVILNIRESAVRLIKILADQPELLEAEE